MSKKYLWTAGGSRLQLMKSTSGAVQNWLFVPGGLGMGSEYFDTLTPDLTVPGNIWHVDLPGNGGNPAPGGDYDFNFWIEELYQLASLLPNVIMVGHSCGGMLLLCQPKLNLCLKGMVLLNSSPKRWIEEAEKRQRDISLEGLEAIKARYLQHPSNEHFREVLTASVPYMCTEPHYKYVENLFKALPISYEAFDWTIEYKKNYEAQWVPDIPTLIICGDKDVMTPDSLFDKELSSKENIKLVDLHGASHLSWLECKEEVVQLFSEFSSSL